jgi:hypothetical protein
MFTVVVPSAGDATTSQPKCTEPSEMLRTEDAVSQPLYASGILDRR